MCIHQRRGFSLIRARTSLPRQIPGLGGYNTSGIFAGLATDPNSFVFCHPEVDPSRCYVYGRRDTTDYSGTETLIRRALSSDTP